MYVNEEQRLHNLMSAHLPENRHKWALKAKKEGRPIIGITDTIVPYEIIHAADMFPYRITGNDSARTPLAESWRPPQMCQYIHHVVEGLLTGEFDFLDGIIHSDWDDDARRFYDLCNHINKPHFNIFLHMPHSDGESSYRYYADDLRRVIDQLEVKFRVRITTNKLKKSIETYEHMRKCLRIIYENRKQMNPPITGTETLSIVMAAFFMPIELYIKELENLIDYLPKRDCKEKKICPRLLVMSDRMDNTEYLRIIEEEGSIIVMDDMDSGSRFFWDSIEPSDDPIYSLAKKHVSSSAEPCKWNYDKQILRVANWVKEYKVDGVLVLPHLGDTDRLCTLPYILEKFEEHKIPVMGFTRNYHLANEGQLRTRIKAFLEILAK